MDKKEYYTNYGYYSRQAALRNLFFARQPEYFSSSLKFILCSINYIFLLYIIFSVIINVFYHYFALTPTFEVTDEIYAASSSILLLNNYNNIILLFVVALGYLVCYYETMASFTTYLTSYCLFFFSFNSKIFRNANTESNIKYAFLIFFIALIMGMFALVVYTALYYFKLLGYIRFNLNDVPVDDLIHEVKLRMDMAKMSFNATVIRFGLHHILKRFMFTKEDYYFTNMDKERINNEKIKKEFASEDYECSSKNTKISSYSDEQTYCGSTFDNNYSNLDNESEPLK